MTAEILLTDLTSRGVRLWAEADRLKFDAPVDVLTDDDRTALRAYKPELLTLLTRPAAVEALTADARLGQGLPVGGPKTPPLFELQPPVGDTGPSVGASACPADVDAAHFFDEILAAGAAFRVADGCPVVGLPMEAEPAIRAQVNALCAARTPKGREFRRLVWEAAVGVVITYHGDPARPRRLVIPQESADGWKPPF